MRIRFKRKESKRVNHKWICFSLALLMIFSLVLPSASFNSVLANENDISLTDETEIMDEPRIDDTDDIGLEEVNEEIQDQGDLNEEDLIESESILDEEELLPNPNSGGGEATTRITPSTRAVQPADSDFIFDATTGTITGYRGTAKDIIIPSIINGVSVKIIGERAFSNQRLTGVLIPESVKEIRTLAFSQNNLASLIVPNLGNENDPDGSGWVGWGHFANSQVTTIDVVTRSVTCIGNGTFLNNKITDARLFDGRTYPLLTHIGYAAFAINLFNVEDNTIELNIEYMGVPFKNGTLHRSDPGSDPNVYSNLTHGSMFHRNDIKKVIIGEKLREIGPLLFYSKDITTIEASEQARRNGSLEYIGLGAFAKCSDLTTYSLGNISSLVIDHAAFAYTRVGDGTGLSNLPDKTTFAGSVRAERVYDKYGNTGDALSTISEGGISYNVSGAFAHTKLQSVEINPSWRLGVGTFVGNSITSLNYIKTDNSSDGRFAFAFNPISNLNIAQGVENIPNYIFGGGVMRFYSYENREFVFLDSEENYGFVAVSVEEITIPNSVKTIGRGAFNSVVFAERVFPESIIRMLNNPLKRIVFEPNSNLTTIGAMAFSGFCRPEGVEIIAEGSIGGTFPDTLRQIDFSAFYATNIRGDLIIPANVNYIGSLAFGFIEEHYRRLAPSYQRSSNINRLDFLHGQDDIIYIQEMGQSFERPGGTFSGQGIKEVHLSGIFTGYPDRMFRDNEIEAIRYKNFPTSGDGSYIGENSFELNRLLYYDVPIGIVGIEEDAFANQKSNGFDIVKRVNGTQVLYIERRIPDADMNKVVPVGGTWANGDPNSGIIEYDVLPSVGGTLYEYKLKNAMIDFGSSLTVNVESYNQQYEVLYKVNTNGEFTNAGSGAHEKSIVVNANESVTEPTLHYDQTLFRMEGWYTTPNFASGTEFDFTNTQITDATTLYAKLVDNTSQVTFHAGSRGEFESIGSGVISKAVGVYPNNTAMAPDLFYDTTKYTFDGWFTSQQFQESQRFDIENTIITGDMSLYAKYQNNVRFVVRERGELVNEGSGVQEVSSVVNDNEIVTAPNVFYDSSQYIFGGWYTSPECLESQKFEVATTPITDGMTLYAKLTTEPPEGSIVDPDDTVWAVQIPRLIKFREVSSIFNADIKLISLTGHEETTQGAFDIYTRSDNGMTMNFEQDDRYKMNYQINVEDTSIGVTEGTTQTLLTSLTNGTPVKRFTAEIVSRIPITGNYSDVLTFVVDRRD